MDKFCKDSKEPFDADSVAKKAVELKTKGGYNCSQAVLEALKDEADIESSDLKSIGAGFCAGMGNMEGTCGALVAACIIAGLKTKGSGTLPISRKIIEEFKSTSKATICKDLKGITTGKVLTSCEDCVKNAILAYAKAIQE